MAKYRIKIEEMIEYPCLITQYEGSDGHRYESRYSTIPDGVKLTEVKVPSGETGFNHREV